MTFRLTIQLPIKELFELERQLGICSRALDMARCIHEEVTECDQVITVVIERDHFTGHVGGYSSPFDPGTGFIREEAIVRDTGDPMNPELTKGLLNLINIEE